MSVVSHLLAPTSLGPKVDDTDDKGMIDNELLLGLNNDSNADPKVKVSAAPPPRRGRDQREGASLRLHYDVVRFFSG